MANPQHDILILGAGPGGYVAAIRAAQLGLDTALVDRNKQLGGTCLRVGCIPSKALLESSEKYDEAKHHLADHGVKAGNVSLDLAAMLKRKDKIVRGLTGGIDSLVKKNKITRYLGQASLTADRAVSIKADDGKTQTVEAKHVVIATGSNPATIPGVDLSDPRVDTNTDALAYDAVPGHLAVIGAGYIGLELGSVWRRLGSKVSVIEYLDRILPGMDRELADAAQKLFAKQGIEFHLKSRVTAARSEGDGVIVERKDGEPIHADRVLVAVGRAPNTEGLGLDQLNIAIDERGFIKTDDHFRTNVDGVYAIGDVIGGAMLAHKAEEEGIACVERIAGHAGHVDYGVIPGVVYTHPEIASVGKTEDELLDEARNFRKGTFPFIANGRARALNSTDGFVKVLAHGETDRVLGVHIIGPRAGDLIAECAAAMAFGASSEDIARTCHAHPTLSEAVKEAALGVDGRVIHM